MVGIPRVREVQGGDGPSRCVDHYGKSIFPGKGEIETGHDARLSEHEKFPVVREFSGILSEKVFEFDGEVRSRIAFVFGNHIASRLKM